jgi:hypothetical protein
MGSHRRLLAVTAAALLWSASVAAGTAHAAPDPGSGQSLQESWVVGAGSVWVWTQDETGPASGGGPQGIELSTDAGRSWSDATPVGLAVQGGKHWIFGLFALNASDAWVTYGGLGDASTQTIVSTTDGGRHWARVGHEPHGDWCSLQFVSPKLGWCPFIGAAGGSATVTLYRTADGGQHWQVVSRTPIGVEHRPGVLPYGGDKQIEFTGADIGWAGYETPIGTAALYETVNAGGTWLARQVAPAPETRYGGDFAGTPTLDGADGAVGYSVGGRTGACTIVYVTSDGGLRWHAVIPPGPATPWVVDALAPRSWRLLYGDRILATDNAGHSWRTTIANHSFGPLFDAGNAPGTPVDFITANIGWVSQKNFTTGNSTLWRTADGGRDWQQVKVPGA